MSVKYRLPVAVTSLPLLAKTNAPCSALSLSDSWVSFYVFGSLLWCSNLVLCVMGYSKRYCAGQYCRPSFGIRQRQSSWTSLTSRTGAGTRTTVVDGCLCGQPSKTAAKPVSSSCSVIVSSHAEGTANAARLVCVAQVSANVKGMCQQWRRLIDWLIYWLAGNCHNSSNLVFSVMNMPSKGTLVHTISVNF